MIMAKLLDATEQAMKDVQLTYSELDTWFVGIMEFLVKLEGLYRLVEPLPRMYLSASFLITYSPS